ncbi:MAG: leucyl aminopeptidase family protein [Candidatus Paceibacterota bacterium]
MNITISKVNKKQAVSISFTHEFSVDQISLTGANPMITLGMKEGFTKFTLARTVRKIARLAKGSKEKDFEVTFDTWYTLVSDTYTKEAFAEMFAYELANAAYEFTTYKKETLSQTLAIIATDKVVVDALKRGMIIAEELNAARELINIPGSHLTPEDLANHAKKAAAGVKKVIVTILDSKKMKALRMNAVLAVGESSPHKPKFICMEYKGGAVKDAPIVFVGKGVTFDTGGSNLKPDDYMNGMHMDMAGGAIAIHTLLALAKLGLHKNIVCLVPAVENRITGDSYLPGDVIVGMSGLAIEVMNTDAEGRVILSDALTYAGTYKPRVVIDLATLTGAAVVALGTRASAVFSPSEALTDTLKALGEDVKNFMWPMPLYDEYKEDIKGDLGGITNTHNKMKRNGGAITGAMFLYQFAKDYPWAHIDIAPRMESIEGDNLATGATAEPLYALVKFAESVDISFL